jgi:hypothetical protein
MAPFHYHCRPRARAVPRSAVRASAGTRRVAAFSLRTAVALACALGLQGAALASPASDVEALKQSIAQMKADYDRRIGALEQELRATRAALDKANGAEVAADAPTARSAKNEPGPNSTIAATPQTSTTADNVTTADLAPTPPAAPTPTAAPIALTAPPPPARLTHPPPQPRPLPSRHPPPPAPPPAPRPSTRRSRSSCPACMSTRRRIPRTRGSPASRYRPTRKSASARAASASPSRSSHWPPTSTPTSLATSISRSRRDNQISAEEAYIATTVPAPGLVLKAGRYFSGIGYLNSQHSHTWDFTDAPLAYQAMLGTQYSDDGLQLHWLAPTDQYLEVGLEVGRGHTFPGDDGSRNAAGMTALTLHTGATSARATHGAPACPSSRLPRTGRRSPTSMPHGNPITDVFSGRTRVWVADGVWKWAPNGNATRTYFKLQGEYLQSRRDGNLRSRAGVDRSAPTGNQSGGYLQGVWQFAPRWRVGLRTELLDPVMPTTARTPVHWPRPTITDEELADVRLQPERVRARATAACAGPLAPGFATTR